MAIVRTGAVAALNSNTLTLPGSAGDCSVIGYVDDDGSNAAAVTGYTQVDYVYHGGDGANCSTNINASASSGTQTATNAFETCLACVTYSGVDTTTPVHKHAISNGTDNTNNAGIATGAAVPGVITTISNCQIVVFVMLDPFTPGGTPTYTPSAGLTKRADTGTGDWSHIAVFDAAETSARDTTGAYTIDIDAGVANVTGYTIAVLALTPAAGGGGGGSTSISWTGLNSVQTL